MGHYAIITSFEYCRFFIDTVEPLLSDPLLSEFSIIQPQTHSPNSI